MLGINCRRCTLWLSCSTNNFTPNFSNLETPGTHILARINNRIGIRSIDKSIFLDLWNMHQNIHVVVVDDVVAVVVAAAVTVVVVAVDDVVVAVVVVLRQKLCLRVRMKLLSNLHIMTWECT